MDSTSALVLSEFYNSTNYFDRLVFCVENDKQILHAPQIKVILNQFFRELNSIISNTTLIEIETEIDFGNILGSIKQYNNFIEQLIKISNAKSKSLELTLNYINSILKLSYQLHQILRNQYDLDLNLPSPLLAEASDNDSNEANLIKLYSIDIFAISNNLKTLENQKEPILSMIKIQREQKYNNFIKLGHQQIQSKNYDEARINFLKASNYFENAEVLTMLAWSYSLLDQNEMAKKYCAKAIQLDSNYGPAFNDFGNYLILEGKIQESLKWFEHAKRTLNYPQREYPYINAGRAYVMLNMYDEALREFSLALALAPHHNELHQTIIKLKTNFQNQTNTNTIQN